MGDRAIRADDFGPVLDLIEETVRHR